MTTVNCPNCNTSVAWLAENQFRPFCSERCKLIDFGEWVMEEKVIAGEPLSDEIDLENPDSSTFE